MAKRPSEVLAKMSVGPIALMSRSSYAAVLVSPDLWNATSAHIAKLEGALQAIEIANRENDEITDFDDLCAELGLDPKQLTMSATTKG